MSCTVRGSNHVSARFSAPVQTGPSSQPASCALGTECFPWAKNGRGVTLATHHFLVPRSRKSKAIPILPLLAVRPAQLLSACKICALPVLRGITQRRKKIYSRKIRKASGEWLGWYLWMMLGYQVVDICGWTTISNIPQYQHVSFVSASAVAKLS